MVRFSGVGLSTSDLNDKCLSLFCVAGYSFYLEGYWKDVKVGGYRGMGFI